MAIGEEDSWASDERVKDGDEQREEVEGMYRRPNEEEDEEEKKKDPPRQSFQYTYPPN